MVRAARSSSRPPASRWAKYTGMIDAMITKSATTFTIGSCAGRASVAKIQIGSVCSAPDVKIVTTTSSKDSANASSPPASSAVRICGNMTYRNVCQ